MKLLVLVLVLYNSVSAQDGNLHGKTLRVLTVLSDPFMMVREGGEMLEGDMKYEGFNADLLKSLSKQLKFKYTLELAADGGYGSHNKTSGEWSGMIGDLLSQKADLVLADLTITHEREQVMDFTMPYMDLGVTILYQKPPRRETPSMFIFLDPFTPGIWLCIISAYFLMFLLNVSIDRCIPGCKEGNVITENKNPRQVRVSSQMMSGVWWVFTLVLVSWYTATLPSYLCLQPEASPIQSVEDLIGQRQINYGMVGGGSTQQFFENSLHDGYATMWSYMQQNPAALVKSNSEGVERVRQGRAGEDYAFFMESPAAEYVAQQKCDLTQVGGLLNQRGYGIGLPLNSPYRKLFSNGILQLQEAGTLQQLKTKWWWGPPCHEPQAGAVAVLSLHILGGIFLVLLAGLVIVGIANIVEYLLIVRNREV